MHQDAQADARIARKIRGDRAGAPFALHNTVILLRLGALAASLFVVVACAAPTDEEGAEEAGEVEGAASAAKSVSLKYEGTCDFLRSCSTWSRGLPEGQVLWGCTGQGTCDDDGLWMAAPNRSYCGKKVQVCKNGKCTTATVKDISVSRDWEASNGVMEAVDLPYGLTGRCSGYGGGKVTVKVL